MLKVLCNCGDTVWMNLVSGHVGVVIGQDDVEGLFCPK